MNKLNAYTVTKTLVYLQAIGAGVISFSHIVEVGQRYGLGWQSYVAPFLIDGFAILGTIGRGRAFSDATRRAGLKLMICAGLVSLACNVLAGVNVGQRAFGVLVVAGYIVAEWYASKMHAAPAVIAAVADEATTARRRAAALKGAATRKARAEAAAKTERAAMRTARRQLAELPAAE
jgi:hypothetical protein